MLHKIIFILLCLIFLLKSSFSEDVWYSYQFGTGYGNREELVIKDVAVYENFKSEIGVKFWKSVAFGRESYAVGMMERGLTMVKAISQPNNKSILVQTKIIDFAEEVFNLEILSFYNRNTSAEEIAVIIVTNNSTVSWYCWNGLELGKKTWSWNVPANISYLQYHDYGNKHILLLINNLVVKSEVLIYEFDGPSLWLRQLIPLNSACHNLAVIDFGSDTYLSVPQPSHNVVSIYRLSASHFVHYQNLTSANVSQVQAFKVGFKAFIAINGGNPGIYKFGKQNAMDISQDLNLINIKFWLVVPVNSYRDDIILIGQRSVHHGPHNSNSIEPFIFNGKGFIQHDEMPCFLDGIIENGMGCLIDDENEKGLYGSAVINVEHATGVLIPSINQSRLFTFRTFLKQMKSPVDAEIEKLEETKKNLEKLIADQEHNVKFIEEIVKEEPISPASAAAQKGTTSTQEFIVEESQYPYLNLYQIKHDLEIIEKNVQGIIYKLKETVLVNSTSLTFGELKINEDLEAKGIVSFENIAAEIMNSEVTSEILNDIVWKNKIDVIKGKKTFTNVDVRNLTVQDVNDHNISNPFSIKHGSLFINDNITFNNDFEVLDSVILEDGVINGYRIEEEVVQMGKRYSGHLNFRTIKLQGMSGNIDSLNIVGNLTATNINDENMEDLKRSICLTNVKNYIPNDLFVTQGVLNVTGELDVVNINGMNFLENYVFKNASVTRINGLKEFTGDISMENLNVKGTVNDVNPNSVVTLYKDQNLSGSYLFHDLEVTEGFKINGNVSGPYVKEFLENPILTQTNNVKARCIFKSLEVDGVVVISENFNNTQLEYILRDVVYADEDSTTISSIKELPLGMFVTNGIAVESNIINTTPLDQFITTDTEQTISLQTWNGNAEFKNLEILGLYGGINISLLDAETVKLTGDQFIATTLYFQNADENFVDLTAANFIIKNTLNGLSVTDYWFTSDKDRHFHVDSIAFNSAKANDVIVDGNVLGVVNDLSIEEFDSRRLSVSKDQTVTGKYETDKLEVVEFGAKNINGIPYEKLFDSQYYADIIASMLFEGKLKISNLHVNGSVNAQSFNGFDLGILQRSLWTNKNNYFNTTVFTADVFVKSLTIENFNSVNFNKFVHNIIQKYERNVTVNAHKIFANGFHLVKHINSERLNGIPIDAILTKSGDQEILGPINIYGDVTIFDSEVHENLNDLSMEYVKKTFDLVDNTLTINDDVVFNRLAYVERLWVDEYAQDHSISDFLKNIVYRNQNHQLPGTTVFKNLVYVKRNIHIEETVNDVDLSLFFDDVLFINKPDTVDSVLIFTQHVNIIKDLFVATNLNAQLVFGIDLANWKSAAFINEGMIQGLVVFENVVIRGNLYVRQINQINMSALVPLRTDQFIKESLVFGVLKPFNDLKVNRYVNGYILADLFTDAIFMNIKSQILTSPLTFLGNVLIREHLHINGLMNRKNLSNIVTTNTDQYLTSNFVFEDRVILESNLNIAKDTVNNISLSNWKRQAVKLTSPAQEIYNRWVVVGNITFKSNVDGTGLIGGFNVRKMAEDIETKRNYKTLTERNLVDGYINMCKAVNTLVDKAQNQIFVFKYFEMLEPLQFSSPIAVVHNFNIQNENYLLVNELDSCISSLFIWNKHKFMPLNKIPTGNVVQFVTVYEESHTFIVSNGILDSCEISGTNVWKFDSDDSKHLFNMEKHQLLHDSVESGTFYGLLNNELIEYKLQTIVDTIIKRYRKWILDKTDNVSFVPHGLGIGLALYNQDNLMKLLRNNSALEEDTYGYDTTECIVEKVIVSPNFFMPKSVDSVVINVGVREEGRSILAVASHEATKVKGRLDFIKIYEDVTNSRVYHKIPAYNASSMTCLEFGNSGQSFLLFMENEKVLQVYEYKGIEGFKHRTTVNLYGSKVTAMRLQIGNGQNLHVLSIVNNHEIYLLQAVMAGNQLRSNKIDCDL